MLENNKNVSFNILSGQKFIKNAKDGPSSVIRPVTFDRTKIVEKAKNATFWVIFKQYDDQLTFIVGTTGEKQFWCSHILFDNFDGFWVLQNIESLNFTIIPFF